MRLSWPVAIGIAAAAALVRLYLAAVVPLFPDETYYWEWSRHLAAGYFDHPPLIALVIRFGTALFGDTPLGVRFGAWLAGLLTLGVVAALGRDLGGSRAARWTAVIASSIPAAALGLILATPDAPLVALLALALFAVVRAVSGRPGSVTATTWWMAAGCSLGGACLAKYPAVIVMGGVLVALASRPDLRPWLRRWEPYAASLVALAITIPVIDWNARHGWISFRWQFAHGLGASAPAGVGAMLSAATLRELSIVGSAALLASPVLLAIGALVVRRSLRRESPSAAALLSAVVVTWLGFFALSGLRHSAEPNWLGPGFIGAIPVVAAAVLPGKRGITGSRFVAFACVVGFALSAVGCALAIHPLRAIPAGRDPIARADGWDRVAASVAAIADSVRRTPAHSGRRVWIAANVYQDASEIDFNLRGHPGVFSLNMSSRPNQFDLWPHFTALASPGDALVLVLSDDPDGEHVAERVAAEFTTSLKQNEPMLLARGAADGDVIARRRVWIFTGWLGD